MPSNATLTLERRRHDMVERQIAGRGVRDPRVLRAMEQVPRDRFVPPEGRAFAYDDMPLPIGSRQTISQPYIVAAMIEALELPPHARVLEIGAGTGYAAAVLGHIAETVIGIERIEALAHGARRALEEAGIGNVRIICTDGTVGWPAGAPYDGILVDAAGPKVPPALEAQLVIGGRLVMPLEARPGNQRLVRVTRRSVADFEIEPLFDVRFVPLIGEQGFADEP